MTIIKLATLIKCKYIILNSLANIWDIYIYLSKYKDAEKGYALMIIADAEIALIMVWRSRLQKRV